MRITKQKLKKIIQEELQKLLYEEDDAWASWQKGVESGRLDPVSHPKLTTSIPPSQARPHGATKLHRTLSPYHRTRDEKKDMYDMVRRELTNPNMSQAMKDALKTRFGKEGERYTGAYGSDPSDVQAAAREKSERITDKFDITSDFAKQVASTIYDKPESTRANVKPATNVQRSKTRTKKPSARTTTSTTAPASKPAAPQSWDAERKGINAALKSGKINKAEWRKQRKANWKKRPSKLRK